jgi:hypothetical protein
MSILFAIVYFLTIIFIHFGLWYFILKEIHVYILT